MTVDVGSVSMDVMWDIPKMSKDLEKASAKAAEKGSAAAAKEFDSKFSQMSKSASLVGAGIATGIGGGIMVATKKAAELEQAIGGTSSVFKEQSAAIGAFAKSAAEQVGLSEQAARDLTSRIGGSLKGYGFSVDQAAAKSIQLTQIGSDLAATFGGTTTEAVEALSSALRGEFDPLERYGIAINQTLIDQKAVSMGLAQNTSSVTQNARAQAALALIVQRSADSQGQFAREADTAAGAAQIAAAKAENAAADFGQSFLPIYARVSEVTGTVAEGFGKLPPTIQTGTLALTALIALRGPLGSLGTSAKDFFTSMRSGAGGLSSVQMAAAGAGVGITAMAFAVAEADSKAAEFVSGLNSMVAAAKKTDTGLTFEQTADKIAAINTQITQLHKDIGDSRAPWDIDYRRDLSLTGVELQKYGQQLVNITGQSKFLSEQTGVNRNEANKWLTVQLAQGKAFADNDAALKAFNATGEQAASGAELQADATKRLTEQYDRQRDQLSKLTDSYNSVIDARLSLTTGALDVRSADRDVRAAQRELGELQRSGKATPDELEAAQDRVAAAIQRRGQIAVEVADRIRVAQTGAHIDATEKANIYNTSIDQTIAKYGAWGTKVDELKVKLDGIAGTYKADIEIATRNTAVSGFQQILNNISQGWTKPWNTPGRAAGGPVTAGRMYEVNERGLPETLEMAGRQYLIPTQSGTVIPQPTAGGNTFHVQVTGQDRPQETASEIRRQLLVASVHMP